MKLKLIFLFFISFQNFLFSQISPNIIEIKIKNQNNSTQKNKSHSIVELKFDSSGKLLKRIGDNINEYFNPKPIDLTETYTYSENGLLKNVIEQEKDEQSVIKPRFISKYFYNEQKQLIEIASFHYIYDSIEKKTTFEYDANGNRIRINNGPSKYILNHFDNNNKYINSQLYEDNIFVENLQIPDYSHEKSIFSLENDKLVERDTILEAPQECFYNGGKYPSQNKAEVVYYKNGILKKIISYHSFNNGPFQLESTSTVKCDGKTKFDKNIVKTINSEIVKNDMWQ